MVGCLHLSRTTLYHRKSTMFITKSNMLADGLKADVIDSDSGLIEPFGAAFINLALDSYLL